MFNKGQRVIVDSDATSMVTGTSSNAVIIVADGTDGVCVNSEIRIDNGVEYVMVNFRLMFGEVRFFVRCTDLAAIE